MRLYRSHLDPKKIRINGLQYLDAENGIPIRANHLSYNTNVKYMGPPPGDSRYLSLVEHEDETPPPYFPSL